MALELIAAIALVGANGFFVATEFAIARLRPTQVDGFEREGRPGAKSVRHAVDHIDAYLAACQLGITLASIGLGVAGKPAFEKLLDPLVGEVAVFGAVLLSAALAFGIITLLHVVVGELAPKSLAIARTSRTVLWVAPPMRLFYLATKPLVDLFNAMGNLLLKPFGIPPASEAGHAPHSEDELRSLLRQSSAEGLIAAQEREFTENVFAFGDHRAREVMVPRPEIDFVTTAASASDVAARATETGHTRLPLCEPDAGLDAPVGVINVKDLLPAQVDGRKIELSEIARPLAQVPESIRLDELLRELRRTRQHVALVMDEHGTVTGLVTIEDLLEELVGAIEDEFDPEEARHVRREDGTVIVDGAAPIRLLYRELGLTIDDPHEATIGGHLLELLGRVPETGERIELDGFVAEVSAVDGGRIATLRFPPQRADEPQRVE
ncbi:MAG: hemolysin family protein [Actinomycetota bacterium]|nr:hemolysin family protein [Actinomycetota bacterium]